MYVYVYMYMYICIYMYIYIYIYTHTHIRTGIHTYIHIHTYACYGISRRCGHCKAFTPKFEKAASYFESKYGDDIVFVKMDGTANEVQNLLVTANSEEIHAVVISNLMPINSTAAALCSGMAQMLALSLHVEMSGYFGHGDNACVHNVGFDIHQFSDGVTCCHKRVFCC